MGIHGVIFSMKNIKHIMAHLMLYTGERTMKLISILLLIYVVLQTIELSLF